MPSLEHQHPRFDGSAAITALSEIGILTISRIVLHKWQATFAALQGYYHQAITTVRAALELFRPHARHNSQPMARYKAHAI
jgi:hypothetical protein